MAQNYKAGLIITGDASGGIRAIKATDDELGKLNQGFDRGSRRSRQFNQDVNATSQGLAVLRRAAAPIAGIFAGMFAANTLQGQINWADQLHKTNLRIGASTEALSQYNYVANLSGVEFNQLTTAWQRQTRRIAEAAQGTGVAVAALDRLKLSAQVLNQLAPEEQFERIAEAMQGVESSSERVRLAQQLWDSEGVKLVQIVNSGTDAIATMRAEADALGLTITQDTATAMATYNDEVARLQFAAQGLSQTILAELVPSLTEGLQTANGWVKELGGAEVVIGNVTDAATLLAALMAGRYAGAFATATAAKLAATQQSIAYQAALARMAGLSTTAAASQTALAGATRAASGAMALLGGPLGVLVGAGGLLFMFREELGLVDVASQNATDALDANSDAIRQGSAAALDATYDNLVVSLEAVSLQAQEAMAQLTELEARQAFYENSHQGMADSVAGAVDQQTEALAGLWARQVELQTAIRNNRDAREQATSADRAGAQALEDMVVTADALSTSTETVAAASREAAAAADELTKSTEAQASAVEVLRNRLIPGRREVVQLADDMRTLTLAIATGTGNVAENIQMIGLLQQQYIEAQNDTDDLAAKTVDAAFTMEGAFDELRLNGLRRLDDGFADLWQGAIDGSLNAGDIMKRALDQTLAEMAHMAITRPIVVQLQGMMGMGGGTTTGGQQSGMSLQNINPQALQSGWDTVSGWFGGGGSSASSGLYAGANTGAVSGTLYGSASTGAAQGGLYGNAATGGIAQGGGFMSSAGSLMQTAGAAYAAYQIGSMAGDAISGMVTDKQANSSWGQNIGAAGGFAIGGPVGAGIGAAIGNVVDSLFGSYTPFQGEFVTRDSQFDASSMNRGQRVDAMRAQEEQDFYYGGFYAQSELGDLGFSHSGSQRLHRADGGPMDDSNLHERAEWGWELAESAAQLDNLVVTLAQGSSDVEAMRDAVQSMTLRSGDAADIIQFALVDRSLAALDAAGVRVTESLRSADAEQFATTLEALVGGINMMDAASAQLSLQFDAISKDALYAVDAMAGLAGGMANLSAQNAAYYDAFYTEEEKLVDLEQQLAQRFSAMGYSLPQTDGEVRALVESFDLMTQSGREQRQAVMSVIGPLDQYITAMEAQNNVVNDSAAIAEEKWRLENDLLEAQGRDAELLARTRGRELSSIHESNRALQERIWAIKDERAVAEQAAQAQQAAAEQAAQAQQAAAEQAAQAQQQLMNGVQTAYQAVEQAVNAERQILENAYRATTDSIGRNMQTVQDAIQETESIAESLNRALRNTQSGTAFAREQGQATLQRMLAAGEITSQRELDDALSAVAEPSEHLFGSFLDYQRDFVGTAHDIYNLSQLTDEQLSTEEKSLRALERQMETAEIQHNREMAKYDQLLVDQAAIIQAEFGTQEWLSQVNQSVLSVETAIGALEGSIAAAVAASSASSSAGGGGSGSSGSSNSGLTNEQIKQFADNAVAENGGDWDAAGVAIGNAAIAAGVTSKQLAEALGKNDQDVTDRIAELGLPQFRYGGIASGPDSGHLAELHGEEAIVPLPNGRSIPVELRGPAALPMPDLPPMPFINQQNSNSEMAVLVKRIEALTEHAKTQGGMQREALKALKALVRQLERWDDQDRVRVSVEKTVEPTT